MAKKKITVLNSDERVDTNKKDISKKMVWFLAIVSFLLYANTLNHGFVLDDIAVIEQNSFVKKGFAGISELFSTLYWQGYWDSNAGLYRPMSLVFFALEWQLIPNNPFIHHFFNVFYYALSIVLLFKVLHHYLKAYSIWIPFFIALLFAAHPIHTEVVANIKSRDEIFCFLFFMLTIYFFLIKERKLYQVLGIVSFLCCLLSKEAGILFLPILLFLVWLKFKKDKSVFLIKIIPIISVSTFWLILHRYIILSSPFKRIQYTYLDNSLLGCNDLIAKIATGFTILARYIVKSIYPYNMSYDYSFNQIPCVTVSSFSFIISLLLVGVVFFLMYFFRKRNSLVSFGIFFFLTTIFLASNIVIFIGTTMGDRLLYTPVLGIIIALVFLVFHFSKNIRVISFSHPSRYFLAVVVLLFSFKTFKRNKDWKSNATLFTQDLLHSPNSARVNFNYATVFFNQLSSDIELQKQQLPFIIDSYKKALAIDPNEKGALTNLGVCYYKLKDYNTSIYYTKKALALAKTDYSLQSNLADAYFRNNNLDEAIANYKELIQNNYSQENTYNYYGVALFNKKEYPEAITAFKEGIKRNASSVELWMNYGNSLAASGNLNEAITAFEKAYELNPNEKNSLKFLAMAYQQLGNSERANFYYSEFVKK
ncbi:tetratricopeptide repeat protein [Flavobacterium cucumis]|uniref:Tetratricopeptide repeat-containing protein n=1 Tax=Flavobacterium cucumis TaxID=416016 RepID=A0A1M7ZYP3_9FLAO|nr:tetratricopeptide repeat protein [Flavobacterium cucumis]SHO74005.1 Tetratricopeptide repeat-containing protein [Flavobacterium cucumis]